MASNYDVTITFKWGVWAEDQHGAEERAWEHLRDQFCEKDVEQIVLPKLYNIEAVENNG